MFNLQRFGANDTVTSSSTLQLDYYFADGDTRKTSLPNPKSNLTASEVKTAEATLKTTQAFVGDKNNGVFVGISQAQIVDKTKVDLDLT